MKNSIRLMFALLLLSLFFVGNLWAQDSATIIEFNPPIGQLTREQTATANVTIKNTGDTIRSFWIGLSFAHETATGDSWPEGWYDIYPIQSNILAPDQEETVSFIIPIYKTLLNGQYYSVTSVWDNFNLDTYQMENRFDSSLWHNEIPTWIAKPDLGMLSFSLSLLDSIPDDFTYQINDWIDLIQQKSINVAYQNGFKPLFVLSNSQHIIPTPSGIPALDAGAAMFIDLSDLCEVTPEGEEGWVTIWLTGSLDAVHIGEEVFSGGFNGGIIAHDFDKSQPGTADYKPETMSFLKFSSPYFSISGVEFVRDGDIRWARLVPGGTFGKSFSAQSAEFDLYKFEMDRETLKSLFSSISTLSDISSPQEYSDYVFEKILNQPTSLFRPYTVDDGDIPLQMGVWQSNLSMDLKGNAARNANYFVVDVPGGTEQLRVIAQNGTGSAQIEVKLGERFNIGDQGDVWTTSYPGYPIIIDNPVPGKYYISLSTASSYENVDLVATTNAGLPQKATNPSPNNGTIDQAVNTNLSWENGGGATNYDVYLGTDPSLDNEDYKGSQTSLVYDPPSSLASNTTYYWRIDAKNSIGTATGDVWQFTTSSTPGLSYLTLRGSNTSDVSQNSANVPSPKTVFANGETVYANISVENPNTSNTVWWRVRARWYEPDGSLDFEYEGSWYDISGGSTAWYWFDYSWNGHQPPGDYSVVLAVNEQYGSGLTTGYKNVVVMPFTVKDKSPAISNVTVSNSSPYPGDIITVRATVDGAAAFQGQWDDSSAGGVFNPSSVSVNDYRASVRVYNTQYTVPNLPGGTVRLRFTANNSEGSDSSDVNIDISPYYGQTAAPTISPVGGTFTGSTQVTLSSSTPGATIRYTIDGSTPTSSSTQYTGPFTLSSSSTVRALAFSNNYIDSEITSATFVINPIPKVATPIFSPNGGIFTGNALISLSCPTPGATIRYTTDGTIPTSSSTEFVVPLINGYSQTTTFTVNARAFKSGYDDSDVESASFTVLAPNMSISPTTQTVNVFSGTATFAVDNTGEGEMRWTASIISGEDWLSIVSGSSGTNMGTITSAYLDNTSGLERTGTIRITALNDFGSGGTLYDVNVVQPSNSIVAWGTNIDGQIDNIPSGSDFIAIAAGGGQSLALRSDGSLVSWGSDNLGQVSNTPSDSDFIAIAAGRGHSLALKNDGTIVSWGMDNYGQVNETPLDNDFIAIAAGGWFSLALRSDGSLVSWGADDYGQVSNTPSGTDFIAIAAGNWHGLALRSDGSFVAWGRDSGGQVSNTPSDSDFIAIAGGGSHNLALRNDGSLVSWGYDSYGQVSNTPTNTDFIAIAGGDSHSLALRSDGSIVAWGRDYRGLVSNTPSGGHFTAVAGGTDHNVALLGPSSTVPDIVGLSHEDAEANIISADLIIGMIIEAYSDTIPAGNVIRQSPVSGSSVARESSVVIVMSLGSFDTNQDGRPVAVIAIEGGESQVPVNQQVCLDGIDSYDPEGFELTHSWFFTYNAGTAVLSTPDAPQTCFTPDVEGDYQVQLTVHDIHGQASDPVTITITAVEDGGEPVPGDLDGDGDIDTSDYATFRSTLGKCEGDAGFIPEADYDQDGCITYADYSIWYGYFRNQ